MNFLFKTVADGEEGNQDADFLVVEIDDATQREMLMRDRLFVEISGRDLGLHEMAFEAAHCTWLSEHTACEIFGDDVIDATDKEPVLVPWSDASLEGLQAERMEYCMVFVTAHGFYWEGIVRHTDVKVRTAVGINLFDRPASTPSDAEES
jgi:hypothetical protein